MVDSFTFENITRRYFSGEELKRIAGTRIGIAGAGGLGSNCAMNLVRCGFVRFIIVDFDVVEESNLNRQFYFANQIGKPKVDALKENLMRINPDLSIKTYQLKLDKHNMGTIFQPCHAVVEAFDKPECKAEMTEAFMATDKLLVCASGLAGFGK